MLQGVAHKTNEKKKSSAPWALLLTLQWGCRGQRLIRPLSVAGTGSSILSALQDLFSITWLSRSKVEKQLQVISVLQWVLSFLVLGKSGHSHPDVGRSFARGGVSIKVGKVPPGQASGCSDPGMPETSGMSLGW